MFESVTKTESRWKFLWPDVSDIAGAEDGIKLGYWGAFAVSGLTAALTLVGALGLRFGVGLGSLIDAAVFALIGLGLLRRWRSAAVVGMILFSLNIMMTVAKGRLPGIVAIFVFFGFISAVRGTFAYQRLIRSPPAKEQAPGE